LLPNPDPRLKSGFPILYNTETQGYSVNTSHAQFGQGIGYRWQDASQTFGFDAIAFHYRRTMTDDERGAKHGTFYGADIDLLEGPLDGGLPIRGNRKEETGARIYTEWHGLTSTVQFTKQLIAGLHRQGEEIEVGYQFGRIQPVVRWSGLQNFFKGDPTKFPAPSIWWNWTKVDGGVRIGLPHNSDITLEHARHNIASPRKLHPDETLVTLRVRV